MGGGGYNSLVNITFTFYPKKDGPFTTFADWAHKELFKPANILILFTY